MCFSVDFLLFKRSSTKIILFNYTDFLGFPRRKRGNERKLEQTKTKTNDSKGYRRGERERSARSWNVFRALPSQHSNNESYIDSLEGPA